MIEGRKDDSSKLRYDLISPIGLHQLAGVYTMGAQKYDDRNWEKGIKWGRIFAAIMRHLWAWFRGENKDPESGMSHLAHAAWGCFALMHYTETFQEGDDRPDLNARYNPNPVSNGGDGSSPPSPPTETLNEVYFSTTPLFPRI